MGQIITFSLIFKCKDLVLKWFKRIKLTHLDIDAAGSRQIGLVEDGLLGTASSEEQLTVVAAAAGAEDKLLPCWILTTSKHKKYHNITKPELLLIGITL